MRRSNTARRAVALRRKRGELEQRPKTPKPRPSKAKAKTAEAKPAKAKTTKSSE